MDDLRNSKHELVKEIDQAKAEHGAKHAAGLQSKTPHVEPSIPASVVKVALKGLMKNALKCPAGEIHEMALEFSHDLDGLIAHMAAK